jgi:hypothetical protein
LCEAYEETTHDDYARDAAAAFAATEIRPGTVELAGPCPRCRGTMYVPVVTGTYKSLPLFRRAPAPAPAERVEPVICTCEGEHPGSPDGSVGCGAYWLLRLTAS